MADFNNHRLTDATKVLQENEQYLRETHAAVAAELTHVRGIQSALINLIRNRSEELEKLEEDLSDLEMTEDWGTF